MDDDLDDEEEKTFSRKVRSISESTCAEDYDLDENEETDCDPINNDEKGWFEEIFYCYQCHNETTKTYQFLRQDNGTWICKTCLEERRERSISTKHWKKLTRAAFGFRIKNPSQTIRRNILSCTSTREIRSCMNFVGRITDDECRTWR